MADSNVPITAGSGTNIDTQVPTGGDHRQVVVLGDPTTVGGVAAVDATFGLEVDVSRIVPGVGATNLGKAEDQPHVDGDTGVLMLGVRNHFTGSTTDGDYSAISVSSFGDMHTISRKDQLRIVSSTITTSTTSHTAGQQVGGVLTLANAARVSGGSGIITGIVLTDVDDVMGQMDVVFYRDTPSALADNAAFTPTDADILKVVGLVQLTGSFDFALNRMSQAQNIAVPFDCVGTTLYATLITRFAYTPTTATALQLSVFVERN